MLRLTLTLIPRGDESKAKKISELEICNDETSKNSEIGNYQFNLLSTCKEGLWARGRLENFKRNRGYWQCIKEVLALIDMNNYE